MAVDLPSAATVDSRGRARRVPAGLADAPTRCGFRSASSEAEADAATMLGDGRCGARRPPGARPRRPAVVDLRTRSSADRRLDPVARRDGDRDRRSSTRARALARVDARGERRAAGRATVRIPIRRRSQGDCRRAGVAVAHRLADLAEDVLGRDDEQVAGHRPRRPSSPSPCASLEHAAPPAGRALARRARPRSRIAPGGAYGSGGLSTPAKPARNGARWRPTIFAGGHHRAIRAGRVGLTGAAGELAAQVARPAAGQEQPAQHRPERLRPEVDAGGLGDRLGRGVGELGGDAALLDREGGDVAGGVDVVEPADARRTRRSG